MEEWRQGLSVERDALEEEKEEPGRADRSGTALPGFSHWLGGRGEKGGALVGQDDVLKVFRDPSACGFSETALPVAFPVSMIHSNARLCLPRSKGDRSL